MKINWTKGLPPKEKKDMELAVKSARTALERLRKLCGEFKEELSITLPAEFESPQWASKRAYKDGQIYAYNRVMTLLESK